MKGQFENYKEIEWTAVAAPQAFGSSDKLLSIPDLENYKLVRSRGFGKSTESGHGRQTSMLLVGSSKTNIVVEGPRELLDEMSKRLPHYVGKTWEEIKNIRLERDSSSCRNLLTNLCDPRVVDYLEMKPFLSGEPVPELKLEQADRICAECKNFEFGEE